MLSYRTHLKLRPPPPFCWLDLATSMGGEGGACNWIKVISLVYTPPLAMSVWSSLPTACWPPGHTSLCWVLTSATSCWMSNWRSHHPRLSPWGSPVILQTSEKKKSFQHRALKLAATLWWLVGALVLHQSLGGFLIHAVFMYCWALARWFCPRQRLVMWTLSRLEDFQCLQTIVPLADSVMLEILLCF